MKYPCDMIQDLLPLYLDGVCSEESKKAIEEHLAECSDCKAFYTTMHEAGEMEVGMHNADRERQKVASFQAVKKKMFKNQILVSTSAVAILILIAFATVSVLKNTVKVVEYKDNISVSMVDGDLVGRLHGSQETYVKIKRLPNTVNGQEETICFSICLIQSGILLLPVQKYFQNTRSVPLIRVRIRLMPCTISRVITQI